MNTLTSAFSRDQVQQAAIATELSGLQNIRQKAQHDQRAALEDIAGQFESIFVNIALKSMRQANEAFADDNYFNSNQTRMYRDMLDDQLSLSLTQGQGIGLATSLVNQLEQYLPSSANKSAADETASLDIRI